MSRSELLTVDELQGALNQNTLYREGEDWRLRRIPTNRQGVLEQIEEEYAGIGFFRLGGQVRFRSSDQQAELSAFAQSHGLSVVKYEPTSVSPVLSCLLLPRSVRWDAFLKSGGSTVNKAVNWLFDDLCRAHRINLVYGDRWSLNILVQPAVGVPTHIDFDLEISGPHTKEFELSQVVYYTLLSSGDYLLPTLEAKVLQRTDINIPILRSFLEGHAYFFEGTEFGGAEREVSNLVGSI